MALILSLLIMSLGSNVTVELTMDQYNSLPAFVLNLERIHCESMDTDQTYEGTENGDVGEYYVWVCEIGKNK